MTDYAEIRLLVMDVDGVMTDGKVTYTSDGCELKSFNIKDGPGYKARPSVGDRNRHHYRAHLSHG
jgi:3-deoxy-D-manno-octulosonate 8-phosphate phosphatase (KDO 8-P phosphatase)